MVEAADADRKAGLVGQFLRFAIVGVIGFIVDSAVLYTAIYGIGLDPYTGRVLSFVAAATTTWSLNRRFTFPGAGDASAHRQWAVFVAFMTLGALVNYGTYAAVVYFGPEHALTPLAGVAAGSIAGLAINFTTSRLFVFR